MRDVLDLPLVFTVDDLRRRGVTQEQAERRVTRGVWHRLQRGIYCTSASWSSSDPEGRHVLTAPAAARAAGGNGLVLSHTSAAMTHGLPVAPAALKVITATSAPGSPRAGDPRRRIYRATLAEDEVTRRYGVAVTNPARTVADCLRLLDQGDAVAIADAAARVVEAEKDRHAQLEALGLVAVRWGERHLYGPEPLFVVRLRGAFHRSNGSLFRGRTRAA